MAWWGVCVGVVDGRGSGRVVEGGCVGQAGEGWKGGVGQVGEGVGVRVRWGRSGGVGAGQGLRGGGVMDGRGGGMDW